MEGTSTARGRVRRESVSGPGRGCRCSLERPDGRGRKGAQPVPCLTPFRRSLASRAEVPDEEELQARVEALGDAGADEEEEPLTYKDLQGEGRRAVHDEVGVLCGANVADRPVRQFAAPTWRIG